MILIIYYGSLMNLLPVTKTKKCTESARFLSWIFLRKDLNGKECDITYLTNVTK